MGQVSIKDIAARAGVSFQTVSKVLKGKGSVSPETRAWIMETAEQLGYMPNVVARSLVSQRTSTIGVVASDFSDFVLAQFVVGAEREARRQEQCVIVGSLSEHGGDAERYIHILLERRVDGILLAAPQLEQNERVGELLRGRLPIVSIHRIAGDGVALVGSNQVEIGQMATQHLLQLGHRRVGTIIGPGTRRVVGGRLRGYQRALAQAQIPYDASLVEEGNWEIQGGYDATRRLLDRVPALSAIFVQNDMMAVGALSALHDRGLRVPEDCAIVGCDDIPIASHTIPPLTTIHVPLYETGEAAMKLLLDMITRKVIETPRQLLPVELVQRASCGGPLKHVNVDFPLQQ